MAALESQSGIELAVRDLGRMDYAQVYALQKQAQADVIARRTESGGDGGGMTILLVEHDPPVITISRRPGSRYHLIATEAQLQAAGVDVSETDRGGDITYHGPGQLVVYPILDLNRLNLRLNSYLRFLEQIVIDVLARFEITGVRDASATGVWVNGALKAHGVHAVGFRSAKIAAIGVRVSRWVTMHGLALNVTTNLDHFNLIVPCGLAGRSVTSMEQELGSARPNMMDDVKRAMSEQFQIAIKNHSAQGPATSVALGPCATEVAGP